MGRQTAHCRNFISPSSRTPSSEEMEEPREKAYRFVAYTAIALSLVSVISTCLTLAYGPRIRRFYQPRNR